MRDRPSIGVSACLTGQSVRFDGGHARNSFVGEIAPRFFDLLPFCPELEIGRGPDRGLTDRMLAHAEQQATRFAGLDGLVVKTGSPSCGLERVAVVVNGTGMRERSAVGIFTGELQRRLPLLPIEEEGRLHDPLLRENFLERVFALFRWRAVEAPGQGVAALIDFHARHKLMLMARGPHLYVELGRIVAGTRRADLDERRERYIHRFMAVMARHPSRGRHINVLMHILGYFKRALGGEDKRELLALFEAYRERRVSLAGPLILLRHHLHRFPNDWLAAQHYLSPYPEGLAPGTERSSKDVWSTAPTTAQPGSPWRRPEIRSQTLS